MTGWRYCGGMKTEPNHYYAYLLRLWPEHTEAEGAAGWRATLEDARSGERLGFASLEQLFAHLMTIAETHGKGTYEPPPPPSQAAQ